MRWRRPSREASDALRVIHLVSPMSGSSGALWGKERVIAALMRAQREGGDVVPRLITFSPSTLGAVLSAEGFDVEALEERTSIFSLRALGALRRSLESAPGVVHTHGYKANVVARIARASGAPMCGLVSTCHGWVNDGVRVRLYNAIDRATAFLSDAVTVTDEAMLARFSRVARARFVANGVEDRAPASPLARAAARARFRFPHDRLVAGTLGRIEYSKGVAEVVEAARRTADMPVRWVIAGGGSLAAQIEKAALPNLTVLGYVEDSDRYLDALDVYIQASHSEGLSLSLLEAMRARLPIVATRVGSTEAAVRSGLEAILFAPGDVDGIVKGVNRLIEQPDLAVRLAAAARLRFETSFRLHRQHDEFLKLYASCEHVHA